MSRAHVPGRTFYGFPIRIDASLVDTNDWYLEPGTSTIFIRPEVHALRDVYEARRAIVELYPMIIRTRAYDAPPPNLSLDQIHTLTNLARTGDETTFRDLARMLGVPAEDLDAMWSGTRKRVSHS